MAEEQPNSFDPRSSPRQTGADPAEVDPAAKSLGDALRVSFRLLGVIMVFVVLGFLLTGVTSIEPQEQGIVKVFGRVVGTVEQGLAYNWPFPIGEIEKVRIQEEKIVINDFWLSETPQDKTREDLLSRRVFGLDLRPGKDGALLTGDRNLLHVKLACNYVIREPITCKSRIRDLKEALRATICNVAIRAAALRTADAIQRDEQAEFLADIRTGTEDELGTLLGIDDPAREAITISKVLMVGKTVPLRALQAYDRAQRARTGMEKEINSAKAEAETILNEAAGPSYRQLVGGTYPAANSDAGASEGQRGGLIGRCNAARLTGDEAASAALLEQIDNVLLSIATSGEAARIIAKARAEKTDTIEQAKSRYKRFAELLPEFKKSPKFFLERHWVEAREEILSAPLVEKIYLPPGQHKTILRVKQDPEVRKDIRREILKLRKEEKDKKEGGS